jgi:hypothetical protein
MWTFLAKVGLGLLNFANGSSFKSLAEAWAANAKAKADTAARQFEVAAQGDKEIALKAYDFYQEGLRMQAMAIAVEMGWWVNRYVRPTFAYLFAFNIGGVVLSSYGWIGVVHALPHPLDWLELGVVGSYFAIQIGERKPMVGGRLQHRCHCACGRPNQP